MYKNITIFVLLALVITSLTMQPFAQSTTTTGTDTEQLLELDQRLTDLEVTIDEQPWLDCLAISDEKYSKELITWAKHAREHKFPVVLWNDTRKRCRLQ